MILYSNVKWAVEQLNAGCWGVFCSAVILWCCPRQPVWPERLHWESPSHCCTLQQSPSWITSSYESNPPRPYTHIIWKNKTGTYLHVVTNMHICKYIKSQAHNCTHTSSNTCLCAQISLSTHTDGRTHTKRKACKSSQMGFLLAKYYA